VPGAWEKTEIEYALGSVARTEVGTGIFVAVVPVLFELPPQPASEIQSVTDARKGRYFKIDLLVCQSVP
jgi:hypothetical protein